VSRREFIALIGGAVAWPITGHAREPARAHRVALIVTTSPLSELVGSNPVHPMARAFLQAFLDLGYADGKNLVIDWRSAEGKLDDLPRIIGQLVADHVDVIISFRMTMRVPLRQSREPMLKPSLLGGLPSILRTHIRSSTLRQGVTYWPYITRANLSTLAV
jgi:hypothetical protein